MPGSYTRLLYHVVFSTKTRAQWIKPEIEPRLHQYLGGFVRAEGGCARRVGGIADHVHLLVRWRADEALAKLMRKLKGESSRWLHNTFPTARDFGWQEGYAAFTVSPSQFDRVDRYIARQREHHRRESFETELRRLLRAHGIDFDERYVSG